MSALQSEPPITLRRYVYTIFNVRFAERTVDYTTTLCLHLSQCPLCRANHRLHYDVMFTHWSMSAFRAKHRSGLHYDVMFTPKSMSALQSEQPITLRRYVYTSVNVRFAERTTDYTTTLCLHLSQCPLCRANHRLHYDVMFTPKSMSALQSEPPITLRRYVYTSVNVRFAERTIVYTTTLCLHLGQCPLSERNIDQAYTTTLCLYLSQCPLCRANHRLHYDVMFTHQSMSALQSEPPITLRRYVYTSVNVRFAERTTDYTTTLCVHRKPGVHTNDFNPIYGRRA